MSRWKKEKKSQFDACRRKFLRESISKGIAASGLLQPGLVPLILSQTPKASAGIIPFGFLQSTPQSSVGTLWTWGRNGSGEVGDGTTTDRSSPVQLAGSWMQISAEFRHQSAIKSDGTLWH